MPLESTRAKKVLIVAVSCALVAVLSACAPAAGSAGSQGQSQSSASAASSASASAAASSGAPLKGWVEGSKALSSLVDFVKASVDESSSGYIPPEDRIAVFDMDGTLLGERFPTYFNDWLYIQRALYDESYQAPAELKDFAQRWEDKVLRGAPFENFDATERALGPKLYEGLTVEEYQDVVRAFKAKPVWGFSGLTYGEAFFDPMVAVVEYLHDNGYTIYVNSATYRDAVRVMMEGTLDKWIPIDRVIGTDLQFKTSGQGDESTMDHTMKPEEDLLVEGELFVKNQKSNKVLAMEREIGKRPVLAFGNSSGDFAMANAALQNKEHPGQAYMLLCDNTELDYGDPAVAQEFAAKCEAAGYHTISMRDDWTTIYGDDVKKVEPAPAAEELPKAA